MTRASTLLVGILSLLVATSAASAYVSGGTFVVKTQYGTIVDNGGAVCKGLTGDGYGGGCLPFPQEGTREGAFIGVRDDAAGKAVAFQVCIDNNGDGVCGGQFSPDEKCRDQIFFSHSDGGRFFNPLGPLPTRGLAGCPTFQGYVVLLCTGAHDDRELGTHSHTLTSGVIQFAPFGSGYGDFCGGGGAGGEPGLVNAAAKAYEVI